MPKTTMSFVHRQSTRLYPRPAPGENTEGIEDGGYRRYRQMRLRAQAAGKILRTPLFLFAVTPRWRTPRFSPGATVFVTTACCRAAPPRRAGHGIMMPRTTIFIYAKHKQD